MADPALNGLTIEKCDDPDACISWFEFLPILIYYYRVYIYLLIYNIGLRPYLYRYLYTTLL